MLFFGIVIFLIAGWMMYVDRDIFQDSTAAGFPHESPIPPSE